MARTREQIIGNYVKYYGGTYGQWETKLQGYWDKQPTSPFHRASHAPKPSNRKITAPDVSTCFSSLTWKNGIATATFAKGGGLGTYEYECTRQEFKDWIAESQGGYFNENIR